MADGAGNCGKDLCNRLQDGGAHVVNQSNGVPVQWHSLREILAFA